VLFVITINDCRQRDINHSFQTMSSKQAELRRLMKLHRAKLEHHDGVSSETELTTQRRSQPVVVKGILKSPSVKRPKGVSSLADYGSSSESEPDEERDNSKRFEKTTSFQSPESSALDVSSSTAGPMETSKEVKFQVKAVDEDKHQTDRVHSPLTETPPSLPDKPLSKPIKSNFKKAKLELTTKPTTFSTSPPNLDAAWQEFEAFLTVDNDYKPSEEVSATNEATTLPSPGLDDLTEQAPDKASVAVISESAVATPDDDLTGYAEIEQTAYEARIARLRNKMRMRPQTQQSKQRAQQDDPSPPSSTEPSNLLAFMDESSNNDLSLLPSAPLGQILRKKRARARALVGWDDDTANTDNSKPENT
jgi:hypothetical protein